MKTESVLNKKDIFDIYLKNPGALLLHCGIQPYAWGDKKFISNLLGKKNSRKQSQAELWMGAHPDLPAKALIKKAEIPLNELINQSGEILLGADIKGRFEGQLPYLFKVLSAKIPLSIQTHPSKRKAQTGFEREKNAGVVLSAKNRNYKDSNHKPELIAALTDFYGLRGFRPLKEISKDLAKNPEFNELYANFQPHAESLKNLYQKFMNLPQKQVNGILSPLIKRLARAHRKKPFSKKKREYWILRADKIFSKDGHHDRGLFSIYLLNLVCLKPGQAMYLPAGILHSYLEGAGMEIMANSNNVLRGGLTSKHVDVPELLNNLDFEGSMPEIIKETPIEPGEWAFKTTADEFELRRLVVSQKKPYKASNTHSPQIIIVTKVSSKKVKVTIKTAAGTLTVGQGETFFIPANLTYTIESQGAATLYKAIVPPKSNKKRELLFRGRRPIQLAFGTSGLRGLVTDITDLEAYINTLGFMDYLYEIGDVDKGESIYIAGDLRPSTDSPKRSIMRAVTRAIEDAGLKVENYGKIPTPALTFYAIERGRPSVMVTGSHIPFDRNGIKFNKNSGEILKIDEAGILDAVYRVRLAEYTRPADQSLFNNDGMFKEGSSPKLPPENKKARDRYFQRCLNFFEPNGLKGKRIVFYQHSAVGRDLLVEILKKLGAYVIPSGRSEQFVPIDTEAITDDKLQDLQSLADSAAKLHGKIDAVVSTDGDSDRPLVVGINPKGKVKFFGGDLLGVLVAKFLQADSISIPISSNDGVDLEFTKNGISPIKTKIGSPYVIQSMINVADQGLSKRIVGWEANGGFMTGSVIDRNGKELRSLPSRDAILPILSVLYAMSEKGTSLVDLFNRLPSRFSKAGLIDNFPQKISQALIKRFSPKDDYIIQVDFKESVFLTFTNGRQEKASPGISSEMEGKRKELQKYFSSQYGFDDIIRINIIDGIRIYFKNEDIAHIRPSGNAPQLRLYTVSNSQSRANQIIYQGLNEPNGILRMLEKNLISSTKFT